MNAPRQVFELARRDFVQRARSKAFLMSMVLTVGIVFVIIPLSQLFDGDSEPTQIGMIGEFPQGATAAIELQANLLDIDLAMTTYPNLAAAEQAIVDGEIEAAVNSTDEIIFQEESSLRLAAAVSGGVATAQRQVVAEELGLSGVEVGDLLFPVNYAERTIEPAETDEDRARQAAALVGLMVLYISILMFGQFVMMGVMEEKQTRVVEVVLSRVRPAQVLIGKVLGIGLLGLIQILALGAAVLITATVVDFADVDLAGIGLQTLGLLVLWYLLGYAFYSVMYGALGATISRQEDMQGVAMLPVLLILPGFFFGQIALLGESSWITEVASFVPLWSPMVMAVRSTAGQVPLWQVLISVGIILLTTALLIKLGGRIYKGAILHSGSKTKLRAAWKSAAE